MFWRVACCGLLSLMLGGCQSVAYLGHLGKGQWQIIRARQPVERLLTRTDTPPELARRLHSLQGIRAFAAGLGLPAEGQFDTYADIHRPYALWSVAATPEFSLRAKTWCYWFVGCLAYRNYFNEHLANDYAASLRQAGWDTHVGQVLAYSTLGWFRDSLLSSQLNRSEADLAELVFHELAHQVVYTKDDPVFNESFAEVVAQEGLRRFLVGRPAELTAVLKRLERRHQFAELVQTYREALQALYQSPLDADVKRQGKQRILSELRASHDRMKREYWGGFAGYDAWFNEVNNARINSVSVYHDLVPGLEALLAAQGNDLSSFFRECLKLRDLPRDERRKLLGYSRSPVELIHD